MLADSSNRIEWLRARSQGITATDVAKLSTERSIKSAAWDKLYGSGFSGNPYTEHGRRREPVIANWVLENFNIFPSSQLFHSRENRLHLATPDGWASMPRAPRCWLKSRPRTSPSTGFRATTCARSCGSST
ncbi:YqaJ viral recombinase family protein [Arthrobacter sp. JCM 19049]|uniref:YqaJ viral recombinase family protein n=1 Tax=Arthrobacter sp. JCM 19049 TaxID=1460643 RepID=UPI0027955EA8|nr:YqaJ viral recombinase family protein [Arthrobacter sp. JCM 19049]